MDFAHENWIGKGEYRWYDGYNFLHTGWLGYASDAFGRLEAGLVRTPFGVGPYGPANSWFFDQHYYLGLADMMKLGATYSRRFDRWAFDVGYYPADMVNGKGASDESARYSNAVVAEDAAASRAPTSSATSSTGAGDVRRREIGTTLGASASGPCSTHRTTAEDGDAYAPAIHREEPVGPFGLMLQLTGTRFEADYRPGATASAPQRLSISELRLAWPVARAASSSVAVSYNDREAVRVDRRRISTTTSASC